MPGELKGILGKGVAELPHIYHFHIDHNAPFLFYSSPQILHNNFFQFSWVLQSSQEK